jgi:2-polyprenyl-3-methyl-5-hydroxy-6-metoxy-1,4-benzoquinol methylase
MSFMKSDKCPVCNSSDVVQLYPANVELSKLSFTYTKTPDSNKTFRSVRCKKCMHVFCSPIPKNIYKNYEDVVDRQYLNYMDSLRISAGLVLPIIVKYKPKGRLLDVGCATGEFLTVAKDFGYSVEGLELSKWSSGIARKKGLRVYTESLKALAKKYPGCFDVVTLFGVIEHFEFPLEELGFLNTLLKPGGVLVIWTGDINSIMSKLLGRRWWYWQGQHIQYFSHKSLNHLAKVSGLKHIKTATYPFVATYGLMNNYLGRYYLRSWLMRFLKPVFLLKPIWVLRLPGEMLWIGRKESK